MKKNGEYNSDRNPWEDIPCFGIRNSWLDETVGEADSQSGNEREDGKKKTGQEVGYVDDLTEESHDN